MRTEDRQFKAQQYAIDIARAKHPECANYSNIAVLSIFDFSGHDIAEAFSDGIDYALNKLWHKTEEEKPEDGQWVVGIYDEDLSIYWLKYNYTSEDNDEWWCDQNTYDSLPPNYWLALPKSPLGHTFSEEIW